jgi:hypothetical protein
MMFSDLSPARRSLVRLFQSLNFGQVHNLLVRDGEPIFVPPPDVLFDVRLDIDEASRPELNISDFQLRDEILRFMARLDGMSGGIIEQLDVRAGLPRRVLIRTRPAEAS